ncbi:MAG: GNAT family N-acetyltransferase [Gemmatimonadota bacterium]|nr:GNAT family N-acetyltransferase [Gemmatimonadota bacterium]
MEIRLPSCALRPWRDEDLDALVRHADDRRVSINLRDRFPWPYTDADAREWIETAKSQDPPRALAIVVDGEAGGGIGVHPMSDVHRHTAEVGYWLGRVHWGRGIATEALGAVVEYAFSTFDLIRLEAQVYEWNPASARVLEKCGFTREGRMRKRVTKEDRTGDAFLYALVRES